ncbi:hypothetical protein [Ottowia caeni]|uniref:hypothetical protein n=1 Tax=Ottowia caeni TaxID=2870339 RepID=UPI001E5C0078|nr:hypothetical protein [Ottowia caeni]
MLAQGFNTIDLMLQKLILDAERVLPDAQTSLVTDQPSTVRSHCQAKSRYKENLATATQEGYFSAAT